jgi:hypothetical protein
MALQPTIDNIVSHFYSGRRNGVARAHEFYERTFLSDVDGARDDFECCGLVIPLGLLEFDPDNVDPLEGYVSDDRLDALRKRAEPTEDERQAYRSRVIAQVEDGNDDADVIPGYGVYRLTHTDGREVFALVTVTGYSFSGVENRLPGLFGSMHDALKDLSNLGHVIPDS